jgi:hypothetical protein
MFLFDAKEAKGRKIYTSQMNRTAYFARFLTFLYRNETFIHNSFLFQKSLTKSILQNTCHRTLPQNGKEEFGAKMTATRSKSEMQAKCVYMVIEKCTT